MKCANENGYSVIRLLQKDIWHDRYDWLQELLCNINKIISKKVVQNIYMCKKTNIKILILLFSSTHNCSNLFTDLLDLIPNWAS